MTKKTKPERSKTEVQKEELGNREPISADDIVTVLKFHKNIVFSLGPLCKKEPHLLPDFNRIGRELLAARFLLSSMVRPRCICSTKPHGDDCIKYRSALATWEALSGNEVLEVVTT